MLLKNISYTQYRILAAIIAIAGLALNYRAYYPGFLSPDSIDQYGQAVSHQYSDWHPPIMAAFWGLFIPYFKGGASLFFIQVVFYWASFYALMMLMFKYYPKFFYLLPFLFFAPFTQNFIGNIWKDIEMSVCWLMSFTIMARAFFEKKKLSVSMSIFTLLLLSYGLWIRFNALPGVLPLLALWFYSITPMQNRSISIKKLIAKTLLLGAGLILIQMAFTRLVLKPIKTSPEYKLFLHDIGGIYKTTGKLYFPDFIKKHPGFDSLYLKEKFSFATYDNIWWNNDDKDMVPTASVQQVRELRKCWMNALMENPWTYLKNRTYGFLLFLRIIDSGSNFYITYTYVHPNSHGLSITNNNITNLMLSGIESQRPMFYMKPWFWLLLNLVLLIAVFRQRFQAIRFLIVTLLLSSLFYYLLEYLVYQNDTDFRYFYWNSLAVSLAFIFMVSEYFKIKQKPNQVEPTN